MKLSEGDLVAFVSAKGVTEVNMLLYLGPLIRFRTKNEERLYMSVALDSNGSYASNHSKPLLVLMLWRIALLKHLAMPKFMSMWRSSHHFRHH